MYGNEVQVGEAIRKSGVPRQDIFISTCGFYPDSSDQFLIVLIRRGVFYVCSFEGHD